MRMRRKLIGLLGLVMISGMLMGMSGVHVIPSGGQSSGEQRAADESDFLVSEESKPENGHGVYNNQEQVSFVMQVKGTEESGVKSISCTAADSLGYQNEKNWSVKGENAVRYHPDLSVFADGEIKFAFYALDQTDNICHQKELIIKKDGARPVVTGRLETSGHRNGDYYSDSCQIYLSVQEDNFDYSWRPTVNTDGTDQYTFSGWHKNGDTADGVLTCTGEGIYQIVFACTDLAGNQSETLVVPTFTIDRTAPVISVTYDNEEVQNLKYYHEARKATITIKERWFQPDNGTIQITQDGAESEAKISEWTKDGDTYQTEIWFKEEGVNALTVTWKDPAGNSAKAYHSGAFVIDRTAPDIEIENIANDSSNNGKVEPVLRIRDEHMDEGKITLSLKELTGKRIKMPKTQEQSVSDREFKISFENFGEEMDGIYKLSVNAIDLAGNKAENTILFTVNRNGSYYTFSPETEKLFQEGFIRNPEKVVIYEQNIDWLTDSSIILSCNGDLCELEKEKDYTVQVSGSGKEKKKYTYTINKKCFEKEGTYLIYVDSRDKADNHSSIEQRSEKAGFILDRTAPNIRMINLEEQKYYHEPSHNFQATVDDNIALSSVRYYLDGKLEAQFSEEDIQEMEGLLELQTKASEEYQTIQVVAEDKAGNVADSGEWHVLVNTSNRTKKQNSGVSAGSHPGNMEAIKEDSMGLTRQVKGLCLAGLACVVFVGGSALYTYRQKKKVSIRLLPDTDDKR